MKLIIELLLIFAPLYLCYPDYYYIKGELPKNDCGIIYPDDEKKRNTAYYIDISSIPNWSKLYLKMVMNNGRFTDTWIRNTGSYEITEDFFKYFVEKGYGSYSRTSLNFKINTFYTNETYYYQYTKQIHDKYLYIAPPPGEFYYPDNRSYIKVCILEKKGISIGIWIGAGALVLVVFILIIIFYHYKRAPKQKYIDTTAFEPIVINASPSTNASNQND